MGEIDDKIQKGVNKVNEYADLMNQSVDTINEANDMLIKGKKFINYWSPENSENRKAIKKEADLWTAKRVKMENRFYLLWVSIIIITIILCIKVL